MSRLCPKTRSRCRAAAYCSSDCQKSHWAEHKVPCKKLSAKLHAVEENAASGFRDHPSWKVHLTAHQRRFLREHHARTACATAWPVCGLETDAMLTGVMSWCAARSLRFRLQDALIGRGHGRALTVEALLERIDREHGAISAYLLAHGLTPTELERLTAVIIDPAATAV